MPDHVLGQFPGRENRGDRLSAHMAEERSAILERLKELVAQPSISTDAAFLGAMQATRDLLAARLRLIGMEDVQEMDGGGHPAVFASWTGAPGKPTFIVYAHYDVQPPDPVGAWTSPPFELTERGGRLYGRGASDVKSGVVIALETVAAFLAVEGGCPVNVKLLLEGEEEIGSPTLPAIIERHRDLLTADAVLSADGGRVIDAVSLNLGCRGLVRLEMTLRTARKDLHSGRYGGATRNAAVELAGLVASLHDAQGRIAVPAFLGGAPPPGPDQRAETNAAPFSAPGYYATFGGTEWGDPSLTVPERLALHPTIDVNGIWSGYTGEGSKTVIPATAHAKLTMRLVPGQDPETARRTVEDHLRNRCPAGVELSFDGGDGAAPAYSLPAAHPMVAAAEAVLERATGQAPLRTRHGGTLPISALFRERLGIDTLMFGLTTPADDVHAPDESFALASLDEGLRTWPMLLAELGGLTPEDFAPFRVTPRQP